MNKIMQLHKIWKLKKEAPLSFFEKFSKYPKAIAQLFYNRKIKDLKQAEDFLNPDYAHIKDPFLLKDINKAVARIKEAVKNKEKVVIYHDYDADGICGSLVLSSFFNEISFNFSTYTPDRQTEGYGLNEEFISKAVKDRVNLIITVDCGINSHKEIKLAKEKGIDVIVVDHHLPDENEPEALAVINPKQKKCLYEFKDLCATGVAYKLVLALIDEFKDEYKIKDGFEKWLLDLVAIATVADMMPLFGENRILVKYGLIVLKKTRRIGLRGLIRSSGLKLSNIDSEAIAYQIAPRINATSRMTHASISYDLLSVKDKEIAQKLLYEVEKTNQERRRVVDLALKTATKKTEKEIEDSGNLPGIILVGDKSWTPGIVGLVAGRLTEKYQRPSFVYGEVGSLLKGSCRGVDGFNVVEVMHKCYQEDKDIFLHYGGHSKAGGFSVFKEKKEKFAGVLKEISSEYNFDEIKKEIEIDYLLSPEEITKEFLDLLYLFEPFGEGNREPLFLMKGLFVLSVRFLGSQKRHVKINVKVSDSKNKLYFFELIGFNLSENFKDIKPNDKIDAVFSISKNNWNGDDGFQFNIKDLRFYEG